LDTLAFLAAAAAAAAAAATAVGSDLASMDAGGLVVVVDKEVASVLILYAQLLGQSQRSKTREKTVEIPTRNFRLKDDT
jgi:hypothetical protein